MSNLSDYIKFNSEFRSSVNLYLSLNKEDKIRNFIPTKSSVDILGKYIDAVNNNKMHANLLLGPYGKGKSHLLLVLLAVLSLDRSDKTNQKLIKDLIFKVKKVDENVADDISDLWNTKGRFLPVLISSSQDDLSTPFLIGITDALKRDGLDDLIPDTYYGHAIEFINMWKKEYPETYSRLEKELKLKDRSVAKTVSELKAFNQDTLEIFREIYSSITSGGTFNPLVGDDVIPMYKSVSEKISEKYGYAGIYIIFDEFSKFIEGQNKKASGNNMKIVQDMCELAADSKDAMIYFTMVAHKGVKEYGNYLSKEIINSFTGIEGRIEEVHFVTSTKNNYELIQNAIQKTEEVFTVPQVKKHIESDEIGKAFDLPAFKSTFNKEDFMRIVVRGCFPLSPISAYLLLNVSEKVAQNERTLFTFISKEEQGSMASYVKTHVDEQKWVVCVDMIYDYFKSLFKKSITNEMVHNEWLNSDYALSRTENEDEKTIIKTLALINIVNKPAEIGANCNTIALASGLEYAEEVICRLEEAEIIYKKTSDNTYVFKTRATSDARNEISKRKSIRSGSVNYSEILGLVSESKYILPRKYNIKYAMTRFFNVDFLEVEEFLSINDSSVFFDKEVSGDGKVVFLYKLSEEDYKDDIIKKISEFKSKKLVVVYSDMQCNVCDYLCEFDAINDLKADIKFFLREENKVLLNELPLIEDEIRSHIEEYLVKAFSDTANPYIYSYICNQCRITNDEKVVDVVENVVAEVYEKAVVVNNELINKKTITTAPIKKARITIIDALLEKDEAKINAFLKGTSAESTIYRALFANDDYCLEELIDNKKEIIHIIDDFITSCGNEKKSLKELLSVLVAEPYGMRLGVIPAYLAFCIANKNEDVICYFSDKEIPINSATIVNMCDNPDDFSLYVSLDNAKKEAYLNKLSQAFIVDSDKSSQDTRIVAIHSAMQKWFRGLPQVTKNIKKQENYWNEEVTNKQFVKFKAIMQAVDGNPYEALFIELPLIFELEDLEAVCVKVVNLKTKLDAYYEYVLNQIVQSTKTIIGGNVDQDLRHTLREWYDSQSENAKNGLYSNTVNDFMRLSSSDVFYGDEAIAEKLSKIIVGVYFDSWNDNSIKEYETKLSDLKAEIEALDGDNSGRQETLIFTARNGRKIEQKYDLVPEGTGDILKNIISDALEDFSDLPVNDKVAILLEMVEKALGQEN